MIEQMPFVWIPGTPIDKTALDRLMAHFPKPQQPPPEAWFMGGVNYIHYIVDTPTNELDIDRIGHYFSDTIGGFKSFPEVKFAHEAWKETYHYLLPHLIHRAHKNYLLGDLINYFMVVHPESIPDLYPEFRSDILSTLGSVIMSPTFWTGDDLSERVIQEDQRYWVLYGCNDFVYTLSSALFFCLKYLTPQEIETWCDSILEIQGRHWHYNFLLWLYEITFILLTFEEDTDLPDLKPITTGMMADTNTSRESIMLPTENMKKFIDILKKHHVYYG